MAIVITSPEHSFIQFDGTDVVESCSHPDGSTCLPVYLEDDIAFQFIVRADTEEEADALCTQDGSEFIMGITRDGVVTDLVFTELPERLRLNSYEVLYNWAHGVPGFDGVVDIGECFYIIATIDGEVAVSNCLKRIPEDCYSSLIEYTSDENVFGFKYCGGSPVDESAVDCEPQFISFTSQTSLNIPYSTGMQAKFGNIPSVDVWIRNGENDLQLTMVAVTFDNYPAEIISIDLGGTATGIIRIS